MQEKYKQIRGLTDELICLYREVDFIHNGNKFENGRIGLKLEDGKYVIYIDNEATHTFDNFITAYNFYQKIIF